ncbi:MAG: hypothetical protein C4K60_17005 [Ideonella sp. MAG2]|nr:MAG: hypothetical protein C4K60_17005 [Ideonella sp. MAG2]
MWCGMHATRPAATAAAHVLRRRLRRRLPLNFALAVTADGGLGFTQGGQEPNSIMDSAHLRGPSVSQHHRKRIGMQPDLTELIAPEQDDGVTL